MHPPPKRKVRGGELNAVYCKSCELYVTSGVYSFLHVRRHSLLFTYNALSNHVGIAPENASIGPTC